jgi:hypothetical protein
MRDPLKYTIFIKLTCQCGNVINESNISNHLTKIKCNGCGSEIDFVDQMVWH